MTLVGFVRKNVFRNKRRSILTLLSIGFSFLVLTLMASVWRAFYIDVGNEDSAERIIVGHAVSRRTLLPGSYREAIRSLPGVRQVVNLTFFGGQYKDNRSRESWYSHRCAVGNTPVVRPGRRLSTGARKPETARTKSRNSREASRMHENHGWKRVGSLPPGC